ncbi:MAG: DNA phosphorothioation-associated protein 4 [Synechococcus sp.]
MSRAQITDRIRIARNKSDFVMSLKSVKQQGGPFQTYADIVNFAAAIGLMHMKREPIVEASNHDPDPIPQEQFSTQGYVAMIDLAMILDDKDPKNLAQDDYRSERARVFEEYANAGLEILEESLKAAADLQDSLLLFLSDHRKEKILSRTSFDLSDFLSS